MEILHKFSYAVYFGGGTGWQRDTVQQGVFPLHRFPFHTVEFCTMCMHYLLRYLN